MKRGMNDMDQWLQHSAEMGNASFNEADWKHMQQLLQPRKKRRFIVFWWLLGLLIGAGIVAYLFLNNDEKTKQVKVGPSSQNNLAQDKKATPTNDSSETVYAGVENKHVVNENSTKTIPSSKDSSSYTTKDKQGARNGKIKSINILKQLGQKTTFGKASPVGNTQQGNTKATIDIHTVKVSVAANDTIEVASTSETEKEYLFRQGELAKIELNLSLNSIKIVDSMAKKDLPKDTSIAKKKKHPNKNEWSLAVGYYTGNIPLESKGINTKLGYSINLGSFSVQPSIGVSTFNPNEGQVHQSISIRQSTGTTFAEVKTTTTYFTPANGFVLHPSVSIGWQIKQVKLFTGVQQDIVLNGTNKTGRVQLDSAFFPVLPVGLVATKAYDASLFNGSRSLCMKFGIQYNIGKRWLAAIEYKKVFDYNTVEGIVDEKKKKVGLLLLVGIRF